MKTPVVFGEFFVAGKRLTRAFATFLSVAFLFAMFPVGHSATMTLEVPAAAEGAPDDPLFMAQWGLFDESIGWLRAKKIMDRNFPDGLVPPADAPVVAIIDSGFERHEDLDAALRLCHDAIYEVRQTSRKELGVFALDRDAEAGDAHGNASLGIVAAGVDNGVGIAGTGFGVVKVLLVGTGFKTVNIIQALDFVIEQKEKRGVNVAVVNLSLTCVEDVYKNQIDKLRRLGVVVVAASGNERRDVGREPVYPACGRFGNVVAVAELTRRMSLSPTSNYGKGIDIAAPGDGMLSFGLGGYFPAGGASVSAPFVSGTLAAGIALYNSAKRDGAVYDELSAPQLINLLYSTANTSRSLAGKTRNGRYISVGAFMEAVERARDEAIRAGGKNRVPDSYPDREL